MKKLMTSVNYTVSISPNYPDEELTIYFDLAGIDMESYEYNTTQLTM